MATVDTLRILYPEFADITAWPTLTVETFIQLATAELEYSVWRTFYARGALALAAHMMAITTKSATAAGSGVGAPTGGVAAIKTGDEQVTFGAVGAATAKAAEASLRTTPYGLEFLRLREQVSGHPLVVL